MERMYVSKHASSNHHNTNRYAIWVVVYISKRRDSPQDLILKQMTEKEKRRKRSKYIPFRSIFAPTSNSLTSSFLLTDILAAPCTQFPLV